MTLGSHSPPKGPRQKWGVEKIKHEVAATRVPERTACQSDEFSHASRARSRARVESTRRIKRKKKKGTSTATAHPLNRHFEGTSFGSPAEIATLGAARNIGFWENGRRTESVHQKPANTPPGPSLRVPVCQSVAGPPIRRRAWKPRSALQVKVPLALAGMWGCWWVAPGLEVHRVRPPGLCRLLALPCATNPRDTVGRRRGPIIAEVGAEGRGAAGWKTGAYTRLELVMDK